MSHDNKLLKALAEIRRRQIVATKANEQTEDVYTNAFVYAVLHSVCPIYHEQADLGESIEESFLSTKHMTSPANLLRRSPN
jgi:hypothetical protein